MDKDKLLKIVERFGGVDDKELCGLITKLELLDNTGRYGGLIQNILTANDKNNFLAFVFETTIAFQFESAGKVLEYEVTQGHVDDSSIDFLRNMDSGTSIYMEARLLQQDKATSDSIQEQLDQSQFYQIAKNADDDHRAIIRLQSVILSKVQKVDRTPIKFHTVGNGVINIIIIEVSELLLGLIDLEDCLLAAYGDPAVSEHCRRGIFGLFQETTENYPEAIRNIAGFYEHIKKTISGIAFLFKVGDSGLLSYELEKYVMWNPALIDRHLSEELNYELSLAIPDRQ